MIEYYVESQSSWPTYAFEFAAAKTALSCILNTPLMRDGALNPKPTQITIQVEFIVSV